MYGDAVYAWSKSQYGSSLLIMALCEVCYHSRDAHRNEIKNSQSAVNPTILQMYHKQQQIRQHQQKQKVNLHHDQRVQERKPHN